MNNILKKYADMALSDTELLKIVDGRASVILYPNLINYKNIDEVLGPFRAAFILFCSEYTPTKKFGHWCLVFQQDHGIIEFFNPYGGYPDDSLNYISPKVQKESNQFHTTLSKLMLNSPYELSYNEFPFQKHGNEIKTCGRWCSVRLEFRAMDIYEFKKFIDNISTRLKISPDEFVTLMTMSVNK
jgi:hypothetical protein